MIEFLPKDIRDGLRRALPGAGRKRNRLRLVVGGEIVPVLRAWDNGFSVDAGAPRLRGAVDLYDGAMHLAHCLILASAEEDGEIRYEFKRRTSAADRPALDYYRDDKAPLGFLPPA